MSKVRAYDGHGLIKACEKSSAVREVRRGKGDHVVVYPANKDQPPMTIPDRTIGAGLWSKIAKWAATIGVLILIWFYLIPPEHREAIICLIQGRLFIDFNSMVYYCLPLH